MSPSPRIIEEHCRLCQRTQVHFLEHMRQLTCVLESEPVTICNSQFHRILHAPLASLDTRHSEPPDMHADKTCIKQLKGKSFFLKNLNIPKKESSKRFQRLSLQSFPSCPFSPPAQPPFLLSDWFSLFPDRFSAYPVKHRGLSWAHSPQSAEAGPRTPTPGMTYPHKMRVL